MIRKQSMADVRRQLAYHEAAHWIVGKALGFRVGEIKLCIYSNVDDKKNSKNKKTAYYFSGGGSSHIDPEPSFESISEIDAYVLNRMAVLTAGVTGQKLVDDLDNEKMWLNHAADDRSKLDELSFILRGIRFGGQISRDTEVVQRRQLGIEAGILAASELEKNRKALDAISELLIKRVAKADYEYLIEYEELNEVFEKASAHLL